MSEINRCELNVRLGAFYPSEDWGVPSNWPISSHPTFIDRRNSATASEPGPSRAKPRPCMDGEQSPAIGQFGYTTQCLIAEWSFQVQYEFIVPRLSLIGYFEYIFPISVALRRLVTLSTLQDLLPYNAFSFTLCRPHFPLSCKAL